MTFAALQSPASSAPASRRAPRSACPAQKPRQPRAERTGPRTNCAVETDEVGPPIAQPRCVSSPFPAFGGDPLCLGVGLGEGANLHIGWHPGHPKQLRGAHGLPRRAPSVALPKKGSRSLSNLGRPLIASAASTNARKAIGASPYSPNSPRQNDTGATCEAHLRSPPTAPRSQRMLRGAGRRLRKLE